MGEVHSIDQEKLDALRQELGVHFPRILSYFAEDGIKSVDAIEQAVQISDAVALVRPAHTLKGEALQFGADALALAAEQIESAAREAVEARGFPIGIAAECSDLRRLFDEALDALRGEVAPELAAVPLAPTAFGRKVS